MNETPSNPDNLSTERHRTGEPTPNPQPSTAASPNQPYVVWGAIVIVLLACIGSFTYLTGTLTTGGLSLFAKPTNTPLPPPVVNIQNIQAQSKLVTVEYSTVTEIYNETEGQGWLNELLGTKESLLMLVHGDVNAGFDLSKLDEDDLWTDGKRVRLVLPAAELLNTEIDFDRTRIVYYDNSRLFDKNNPNLQGEALKQAKEAIDQAALQEGILERADEYGKLYFENFLYSLGFTDVEVVIDAQIIGK
ncbi:MAG: DUF4230 domain-containing protein [Anaerolineaceae bacterium]|nr:DUF4230 domain-containing protein [Anaerolineaceae bacterium]